MIESLSPLAGSTANNAAARPVNAAEPSPTGGFEQALVEAVGSAVGGLRAGEAAAVQGIMGAASPVSVVESVMEAQRSLQTVLAIRDKLVSAWQDLSRMAI